MEKFIYFDLDDTLIHENNPLTADTVEFLENLTQIKYGVCTNRPFADSKGLSFLKQTKRYICEGGVVSYGQNDDILYLHPSAVEINHEKVLNLVSSFLNENKSFSNIRQNKSRVYTSTLTFDAVLDLKSVGDFIIKNYPLDDYHFVILGKHKICLIVKDVSKEYMINAVSEENHAYFLISDDEPKINDSFNLKLDYISVNPENYDYNERCLYVSNKDSSIRLVDAIEFVINLKLI